MNKAYFWQSPLVARPYKAKSPGVTHHYTVNIPSPRAQVWLSEKLVRRRFSVGQVDIGTDLEHGGSIAW